MKEGSVKLGMKIGGQSVEIFKFLRVKMREIGKKVLRIGSNPNPKQSKPEAIQVGRHTYGWENISLPWVGDATVVIGSFTSIAANLTIQFGGNHNVRWISTYPFGHTGTDIFGKAVENHPVLSKGVSIGNDVWIGNNVTIMGGVKIGNGAVVAMNSHVVGDIGDYEIYGGNPARKISDRFPYEIAEELKGLQWWEADDEQILKCKYILAKEPTMDSISELKTILGK
jgi:acetyltransferase-like isoleucine patch superfamily enzyme